MIQGISSPPEQLAVSNYLGFVNWWLALFACLAAGTGFILLYSAAGGNFSPWADVQMIRFGMAFLVMIMTAMISPRIWYDLAYWLWAFSVFLLVIVEFMGAIGGGAERWIDLGILRLQPSEIMKITLIVVLARYFHAVQFDRVRQISALVLPVMLLLVPTALVLKQPDLGMAVVLFAIAGAIFFLSGVRKWKFFVLGAATAAAVPLIWNYGLKAYQKARLLTFLDPSSDPLAAGFHIAQSKIALGSGGILGKGFLQGTQVHLNFVPEMHTDFIFTVLAEEFGIIGGFLLLAIYLLILFHLLVSSIRAKSQFGRLVAAGIGFTFFLYLFINLGMVMGLLPVVGIPLPLVSYGGTSMLTLMFSFGLVMSVVRASDEHLGDK
ncbi:MAG: rod shape-determining protein RodA [Rhodospirillaceae bacterium]|nr:rod shape-determining protein RodA [Rhodospirillaceae bacterium]